MDNNQNDNSKSKWCPNVIFEKGNISIGEFKTLDEAMSFPIPDKWCVNRTVGDNKFEKYMALNVRVLIICDWSKSIQDSRKFVIALVYPDGQTIYFDFNDIQIDANEYETSLDEDVFNAIERVVVAHYKLHNTEGQNENKQHKTRYNMKKTIRLSESDLHRVIKESVQTILKESNITPNLEQEMERYRDNPNRFMHTLNAYGMRYESILKDAEKMGLDDIAEIAKQRLHQISDEMIKAREQWNLHA